MTDYPMSFLAGCSKTTLARAAATASKASLFPLSGAQLYSMYVGEGEGLLRSTFKMARQAAPSIIFLDEVDSLAGHLALNFQHTSTCNANV